ncbi:hypothetical protein ACFVHW_28960 [Streptomyces sp. NPDC127110]|uniref:terpene synthase family protein n=1 Tax=Streptomyces sp. NPDC127110 TaxID=3345362 RepID=UPI0036393EF8
MNPATADAAQEVYALVDELDGGGSILADAAADVFLAEFVGRFHPDVPPQGLRLAMLSHLVFFGHEARFEQGGGHRLSLQELDGVYDRALAVFDGAAAAPSDKLITHILERFGTAVRTFDRPEISARIHTTLEGYLRALWEHDFRNRRKMPSLATYQAMRPDTASQVLHFELFPLICDLDVPVTLLEHPVVRRLQGMQQNYSCWVNDVFSLAKEMKEDGALNLVFVLREARNLSLQQAVDAAAGLIREEATDYLDLKARLPHLGVPLNSALAELLDEEERWNARAISYQQRAPRFSVTR